MKKLALALAAVAAMFIGVATAVNADDFDPGSGSGGGSEGGGWYGGQGGSSGGGGGGDVGDTCTPC